MSSEEFQTPEVASSSAASTSATILLVDDDAAMASILHLIGREDGYAVLVASDGAEGLRLAEQTDCDLIILDLNLPSLTGLEVCRKLRTAGVEVPVIMVSVNHETVDKVVGLELGADDYIVKPFEVRELRARINAQLRRRQSGASQIKPGRLKFPGLIIDVGRHEVLRDGEEIPLTLTEFNLLALLASRSGRVVSRQDMILKVWGHGIDLDVRSVDAHIYRLRRKIEPKRGMPTYVHAVPGVGYKFNPPQGTDGIPVDFDAS